MAAPSKDAVYAELRKQGIHAIRVTERIVPVVRRGLKGLRKRDLSLIVSIALILAALLAFAALRWHDSYAPLHVIDAKGGEHSLRLSDPDAQRELRLFVERRRDEELAYRDNLIRRVKKGELSIDTANEIFRAMGLPTIPQSED